MWITGKLRYTFQPRGLTSRLPIDITILHETVITNRSITVIPTTKKSLQKLQIVIVVMKLNFSDSQHLCLLHRNKEPNKKLLSLNYQ